MARRPLPVPPRRARARGVDVGKFPLVGGPAFARSYRQQLPCAPPAPARTLQRPADCPPSTRVDDTSVPHPCPRRVVGDTPRDRGLVWPCGLRARSRSALGRGPHRTRRGDASVEPPAVGARPGATTTPHAGGPPARRRSGLDLRRRRRTRRPDREPAEAARRRRAHLLPRSADRFSALGPGGPRHPGFVAGAHLLPPPRLAGNEPFPPQKSHLHSNCSRR